jgi:hypothetical protein
LQPIVTLLGVLFLNALISTLVWKLIRVRTKAVRAIGRVFATICCFANLLMAGIAIRELWLKGGDWFYIALLVLGLIFAFRFGGGISAGGR